MEKITTQKELYEKLKPALRTKKHELVRAGFKYIKEIDIWEYNIKTYWRKSNGLTIAGMVDNILNTSDLEYEKYTLNKLENRVE